MDIGSIVLLSETAKITLGIADNSTDTFGIIVDRIDLTSMFDSLEQQVVGYRVLVPNGAIEIMYPEDISRIDHE
jgi:hypothetical protein